MGQCYQPLLLDRPAARLAIKILIDFDPVQRVVYLNQFLTQFFIQSDQSLAVFELHCLRRDILLMPFKS